VQADNSNAQYRLMVDSARRWFRLVRMDRGANVPLVDWTPSAAIATGTAPNLMELSCIGDTIAARINGAEVASVHDATYTQGKSWLGFSSIGRLGEARFADECRGPRRRARRAGALRPSAVPQAFCFPEGQDSGASIKTPHIEFWSVGVLSRGSTTAPRGDCLC